MLLSYDVRDLYGVHEGMVALQVRISRLYRTHWDVMRVSTAMESFFKIRRDSV